MDLTGRIIAVLPERGGVSARTGNEWKVASYVLETMDQYPKKMVFDVFGADRIQQFNIQVGEVLTVSFDVDAHEYQGRWFNSIRAFRVDRNVQGTQAPVQNADAAPFGAPAATSNADLTAGAPFVASNDGDDLPF